MKNLKKRIPGCAFRTLFIVLFLFVFVSCADDKDTNYNFIGNWELTNGNVRSVIVLEKNKFQTEAFYNVIDENEYQYSKVNGDLRVANNNLIFKVTKILFDTAFLDDYVPSGVLTEFIRGTPEFEENFGWTADYACKYEVIADTLKLYLGQSPMNYVRK